EPAVETEAEFWSGLVDEEKSVAQLVEAFLVERGAGNVLLAPIAGCNVRAAHTGFELAFAGDELQIEARCRDADHAGALDFLARGEGEWRGFGGAQAGEHQHALAGGLD